jgi:2-C-methyl-D-erythritol 4-phosphate cytidylyltransferase
VRLIKDDTSLSLKRDDIYLVQTPQIFQYGQLKAAYLQEYTDAFTDDASVVESAGFAIHLVEGDHQNIKITFPEDIAIAELILKNRAV